MNRPLATALGFVSSLFVGCAAAPYDSIGPLVDGHRIACHDSQRGHPNPARSAIVLIPGWACDRRVWKHQLPELEKHHRVLAIDLLGCGESAQPDSDYTIEQAARAVANVLAWAKVNRAVLVGHSNGAPVAREFYRLHPTKTAGLVYVDGALKSFFPNRDIVAQFARQLEGKAGDAYVDKLVRSMLPKSDADDQELIHRMMTGVPEHVRVRTFVAAADPKIWHEDPINVPVLMVMAKSPSWSEKYHAFVKRIVPDLRWQMWEGVSHFLMIDEPQRFNRALLTFIRDKTLLD